ncbi:hypothetical protein [Caldalkalibacillus uzonensis]|uniref:hypothetical protein n=1 Tax=Caldalkalibacillus uzonensis TaxID=353224 RepID=UPI003520C7A7
MVQHFTSEKQVKVAMFLLSLLVMTLAALAIIVRSRLFMTLIVIAQCVIFINALGHILGSLIFSITPRGWSLQSCSSFLFRSCFFVNSFGKRNFL